MWVALAKATGFDKLKWQNQNKREAKTSAYAKTRQQQKALETAQFLNVDDNAKCKEKQNKSINIIAQIFQGWPI